MGGDGGISFWDPYQGVPTWALKDVTQSVTSLAFNHSGAVLAAAYQEGIVALWDPAAGRKLCQGVGEACTLRFGPGDYELGPIFGADTIGLWKHTSSFDRKVYWQLTLDAPIQWARFAPDGRWLLLSTRSHGVRLWDVDRERVVETWRAPEAMSAAFSPSGEIALYGPQGLFLRPLRAAADGGVELGTAADLGLKANDYPPPVAFSADGNRMAVAKGGREMAVLDRRSKEWKSLGPNLTAARAQLSPDGRWLLTGSAPLGTMVIWDTTTGQQEHKLPGAMVPRGVFSPDGRRLVVSGDRWYRSWDVGTWRPAAAWPLARPAAVPGPAAFTPDSRHLALLLQPERLDLVSAETGEPWLALEAPIPFDEMDLHFSPSGDRLVIVGNSGTLRVWELARARRELAERGLAGDW
jgi:WD40 repeat protein